MRLLHQEVTEKIIKAFYNVYNKLGHGYLEKVYERSMVIELRKMGLEVQPQHPIKVYYDKELVGDYFADLLVEGLVIVELKVASELIGKHEAQILNYLKATDREVGLLLNFGLEPQISRKIYTNDLK